MFVVSLFWFWFLVGNEHFKSSFSRVKGKNWTWVISCVVSHPLPESDPSSIVSRYFQPFFYIVLGLYSTLFKRSIRSSKNQKKQVYTPISSNRKPLSCDVININLYQSSTGKSLLHSSLWLKQHFSKRSPTKSICTSLIRPKHLEQNTRKNGAVTAREERPAVSQNVFQTIPPLQNSADPNMIKRLHEMSEQTTTARSF